MQGHLWTIGRNLQHRAAPPSTPASHPWSVGIGGASRLTGAIRHEPGTDTIVIVVHGLGGGADSGYCLRAAATIARSGWSCLRLNLRGADGRGDDVYHAGLVGDLETVLASPSLRRYSRVFLLGYSLGGHVALRYALDPEERVRAVAAVCSPLDLEATCRAIDRRRAFIYRYHVLSALKRAYRAMAARREVPTPPDVVDAITALRDWDRYVVVPRHGFDSVEQYYESMSAGPRLAELRTPALYVGTVHDPMVPVETVTPSLEAAPQLHAHMLESGGHVGFPPVVTLDGPPTPLETAVLHWCEQAS